MNEVYLSNVLEEVSVRNKDLGNIPVRSVTNQEGFCSPRDFFSKDVCSKDLSNYKIVKKGEFAYNPSRINVGSIDFLREEIALVSPLYVTFKCKGLMVQKYLKYYLKGEKGNIYIRLKARGAVRDTLSFKSLAEIKIPLYPFNDQKQIVHILDTADTLRQKRKEQLNLLDDYLKSVFIEMFGYPVLNDKEWETTYLDSVIDSIDSGWSPVCLNTQRQLDEIPVVLKLSAVTYCYFNPKNHKVIPSNIKIEKRVEAKSQDLLFTRKNTKELVAASVFVFDCERNLLLPDTIFRLNYKKELVSGIYLWKLFVEEGFRRVIQNLATGSAGSMPNISKENLRKLLIPVPPLQLQNKFASIVEQVEQTKQKMRASLDQMDNHFNALMQRYFG